VTRAFCLPGGAIPVSRFDYDLPPHLIAQHPIEPRDASRLLVLDRRTGCLADRQFVDLPSLLVPGDLLVINDTRVFPARILTRRESGGGVEILLLARAGDTTWLSLAKPGRKLRDGEVLVILDDDGSETPDVVTVVERRDGQFVMAVDSDVIERRGRTPLPPYIHESLSDPERYQTVYASERGSAAAPTAGMHFTEAVMEECIRAGASFARVTLHVGLDTFQPIKSDDARDHRMHTEWFRIGDPDVIRAARRERRRIIAIGTTSVRTLEAAATRIIDSEDSEPIAGRTDLFITPGYEFKVVDAMVTNFHLPRTTLMLLVSALAGEDRIRHAYEHAIRQRYRFLSFGDAMLIV
jgi:S-adenosylmethionine:tRNA ribosyltransferase-isomerase